MIFFEWNYYNSWYILFQGAKVCTSGTTIAQFLPQLFWSGVDEGEAGMLPPPSSLGHVFQDIDAL